MWSSPDHWIQGWDCGLINKPGVMESHFTKTALSVIKLREDSAKEEHFIVKTP